MESAELSEPFYHQDNNASLFVENNHDLCLVCCSKLPYQEDKADDNDNDNHLLSTNLSVIFLLRNLLKVPEIDLQWNLGEYGNPGNWIRLCDICSQLTRKAEEVHWQIVKLQLDLRSTQFKIVEKVKKSAALNDTHDVEDTHTHLKAKNEVEGGTQRKAIWRRTRAFIQKYDYSGDGNQLCNLFIEGDRLAGQLVNPLHPVIKEEIQDDEFYLKEDNEQDLVWGGSDDEIETGIRSESESDPDWSGTTTRTPKSSKLVKKKKRNYSRNTGKNDKWECRYCDKVFGQRHARDSHQRNRHPDIPGQHICHICQKASNSHGLLLLHMRGVHNMAADGSPVPPKYPKKVRIPKDPKTELTCRYCGKEFNKKKTRRAHELEVHPAIPGQHVCDICGKAHNSNLYLLMHRRKVHYIRADGSTIPRTKITKKTSTTTNLSTRKKIKKPSYAKKKVKAEQVGPITCEICGATLATPGSYQNHVRFSHEKRYNENCEKCGMGFLSSTAFKMHLLARHKEDPRTIKLVEEGFRIWKCEVYGCPSKFMKKISLENHTKRFHSSSLEKKEDGEGGQGEDDTKRYTCAYCGKGFWGGAKLKKHERNVHELLGTADFKCEVCGVGLRTPEGLHKHQRQVHKMYRSKRSN